MSSLAFEANDVCGIARVCDQENFYTPLYMSGYLTPLQRKKLREKRKYDASDYQELGVQNVKKIKKSLGNSKKKTKLLAKPKEKTKGPYLRCALSKIIHKVEDRNPKDKKFFKTSSSRLDKVMFTLPFSEKINLKNESNSDEIYSPQRKNRLLEKYSVQNEQVLDQNKPFENLDENLEGATETPLFENTIFDFQFPPDDVLLKRQENARIIARKRMKEFKHVDEHKYENNPETEQKHCKFSIIFVSFLFNFFS